MQRLSNNNYNYTSDLDSLSDEYYSNKYKEDIAGFTKNLFLVLKKITNNYTLSKFINDKIEFNKMSNTSYLYLKDIIKMLETDEVINLSKYNDVLFSTVGKIQERIKISTIRNVETEFILLIKKIDIVGMLEFLKTLSIFKNER
jgi:hypothetical protein